MNSSIWLFDYAGSMAFRAYFFTLSILLEFHFNLKLGEYSDFNERNFDIPKHGDVVEIRYLYAYEGGSLFQPVYLGVRDDLDKEACKIEQLKYKSIETE